MHFGHVEAADEVGHQTGGVPGGARGEFAFFDEQGVGPALVGQMVEQAHAHGAAADDYALCFVAHAALVSLEEASVPLSGTVRFFLVILAVFRASSELSVC